MIDWWLMAVRGLYRHSHFLIDNNRPFCFRFTAFREKFHIIYSLWESFIPEFPGKGILYRFFNKLVLKESNDLLS
jgi:hypothetical protein